ncbi:MAG: pyridoxamine 5'-phosphate oxidase family protein [Gemmatimonadaceae bacterium]|nr:pyridoxamine 5'-phosphate oxidase family protein [Gemmatimonadaceae bacterium]
MPNTTPLSPDRAKLQMHRERAVPDQAAQFLRDGLIAHVGIADAEGPLVIPMTYHFDQDTPATLYLHGAHHSRLMQAVASGERVCVTVTITDGLVYSKTALNHSVNYRSVVAFCHAAAVQPSLEQSRTLLQAMIARYWDGRAVGVDYSVIPEKHLETTAMVALDIEAISAKQRVGGPNGPGDDDPAVPGTAGVTELRPGR